MACVDDGHPTLLGGAHREQVPTPRRLSEQEAALTDGGILHPPRRHFSNDIALFGPWNFNAVPTSILHGFFIEGKRARGALVGGGLSLFC